MKVKDLQDAVNSIQISDKMQEEMIRNIRAEAEEGGKNASGKDRVYRHALGKRRKMPRAANVAAAVVAVIAISGALSFPVRAIVHSLIQERMEQQPAEEMTAIAEDLNNQHVGADSFSRAYTEEEEKRLSELAKQYQAGTFPSGELFQAQSVEEAESRDLCFLVTNGTFYLPDRELTDEELLEIIDFYAKREYALTKRTEEERADEIAAKKEQEKQQIEEVVEAGGITEEEAIQIAAGYLVKIFGITGEGLENNHYYEDELTRGGENELYQVNWTDFPSRKHYYFYISAKDGSLVEVSYTGMDILEDRSLAAAESEKLLSEVERKAVSFIEEDMQLSYEDAYSIYFAIDGTLYSHLSFKFVQGDEAYTVEYTWDGIFCGFYKGTFSTYEQEYDKVKENIISVETFNKNHDLEEEVDVEIDLHYEKIEP